MKRLLLKTILFALPKILNITASRSPAFRSRLRERNLIAWIGLKDGSIGRVFEIRGGRVDSRKGTHPRPDVKMVFKDVPTALKFLLPNPNPLEIVHAAKNFLMVMEGRDEALVWFTQSQSIDGTINCVSEAEVRLWQNGVHIRDTVTDDFGDFRFGGLPRDSGNYQVEVRHDQGAAQRACTLGESDYLGELMLEARQGSAALCG